MDSNEHIKSYLRYYLAFTRPPNFAVMINGPWGIGKTHMLRCFLKATVEPETKLAYVSLNGIDTIDGIDDALFRATHMLLDNKVARLGERVAKAALKYVKVELDIKDLVNKTDADILVFDDLERCSVPINVALGYINEFVEHEHRKVIVVANEAEIGEKAAYSRIREKLIGRTFDVQSMFDEAIATFFDSLENVEARSFLKSKSGEIEQIFQFSESRNLRILQQALWDFERFYVIVRDDHKSNDVAMTAMLAMLLALSFELRAGRLKSEDLNGRRLRYMSSLMGSRENISALLEGLAAAQNRYPGIDLSSAALSDQTLCNFLVKGIVRADEIHSDLDASSFYVKVEDEQPWRTVWYSVERTDAEVDAALEKMEESFRNREYTEAGIILHVFGLRLWLAERGAIGISRQATVLECRKYVDDLFNKGELEPAPIDRDTSLPAYQGYAGLGMYENEAYDFRELFAYLAERRREVRASLLPDVATDLLNQMIEDPELFGSRIGFRDGSAGEFYSVPVLAAIDPQAFVDALLTHHPKQLRSILISLYIRYDSDNINRSLIQERQWASELRAKLLTASERMPPIAKNRVTSIVAYALDPVLGPMIPALEDGSS